MSHRICAALAVCAGLAAPAFAQLRAETSWKFDNGVGSRDGITKLGGPAEVYPADLLAFNSPTPVTTNLSLPIEGLTEIIDDWGTCSSFGLPVLAGVDRTVYKVAGSRDTRSGLPGVRNDAICHVLWPGTGPDTNGPSDQVNQFTFVADILIPTDVLPGQRVAFLNDGYGNYNNADATITVQGDGSLAFAYRGTAVPLTGAARGQWFRLAFAYDQFGGNFSKVFLNGTYLGNTGGDWLYLNINPAAPPVSQAVWNSWGNRPCVFAPYNHAAGGTLFGDYNAQSERYFIANLYFAEGAVCDAAIQGLGGPSAAGLPFNLNSQCSFPPNIVPSLAPAYGNPGFSTTLTAVVTPGVGPVGTSHTVSADLSAIGLGNAVQLFDDGTNGDPIANDLRFTAQFTVPANTPGEIYDLPLTVTDNLNRSRVVVTQVGVNWPGTGTHATSWDFENPGDLYASTCGDAVASVWGNAAAIILPGSTTTFGIPNIGGQPANVIQFPAAFPDEAILIDNHSPGNGGGYYVNQYTLVFDILWPSNGPTPGRQFFSFFNTNDTNSNAGDAFASFADGTLGLDRTGGPYSSANAISFDTWYRVAYVLNTARGEQATVRIYVNGAEVLNTPFVDGVDGRMSLYSTTDGTTPGEIIMFSENTGNWTGDSYINSMFFVDKALSAAEVGAFGGPSAAGIGCGTPVCIVDLNGDGVADFNDYLEFLNLYNAQDLRVDFNGDGVVDFNDYLEFLNLYNVGC